MPLVPRSEYEAPALMSGPHLATILPSLFRRVRDLEYERERLELDDGDFLDLDWARAPEGAPLPPGQAAPGRKPAGRRRGEQRPLVILTHGLEGTTGNAYMRGMARAFRNAGYDVLAWNHRSCSGEPNRLLRFYHSGWTEDLHSVIAHGFDLGYEDVSLIGFSLGGNQTLKYAGERGAKIDPRIRCVVAFSTPIDLAACSRVLAKPGLNRLYMLRFMKELRAKIERKARLFPGHIDPTPVRRMRTFREFDDVYTGPIHGFADAEDYWRRSSARQFIPSIRLPALLVNARNDPFLAEPECFPYEEAQASDNFFFEAPDEGGHVGFARFENDGRYWSELRALAFVQNARIGRLPDLRHARSPKAASKASTAKRSQRSGKSAKQSDSARPASDAAPRSGKKAASKTKAAGKPAGKKRSAAKPGRKTKR